FDGLVEGEGEVGQARLALVEPVGVALDEIGRCGRQPDVQRLEADERRLPGAVDGTMALVRDDYIEITRGVVRRAPDHGLQEADRDLLLLLIHARLEPVAAVLTQEILDGPESLFGELLGSTRNRMRSAQPAL